MTAQVYIYPKIERQLAGMMRQSNSKADAPAIAAQRARQIIDRLTHGISPANAGLMKPRTDKRIKSSLKFDLGSGFRLICIKEKPDIHVMFAGDHESSSNWMDHHAKKKPHKTSQEADVFKVAAVPANKNPSLLQAPPSDDDPFQSEISQQDLRQVFSGLCSAG